MKTRNALLFTFLVGLILACSNSVGPDNSEYPKRIGSFLVTSPIHAEYTGINAKSLKTTRGTDTLIIESPDNVNLTLTRDTTREEGTFHFRFIDSTFTAIPDSVIEDSVIADFAMTSNSTRFSSGGAGWRVRDDHSMIESTIEYSGCDNPGSGESNFALFFYWKTDIHYTYKYYLVKANAFEDVIANIACD